MRLNTKPLKLEYKNKKLFLDKIELKPSVRRLKDMKEVLMNSSFINEKNQGDILYLMYRDLKREEDKNLFEKYKVRYDITIIFPKLLGNEFNKTFGHVHPIAEKKLTYPEVYEILHGKALFILQEFKNNITRKVLLIFAKKNEKVLIPPNYGHVTVNIGKKDLILSNLVSSNFSSVYEIYKEKRGAAVYIARINNKLKIIRNENYNEEFEIKYIKAKELFNFPKENLYFSFIENPEFYKFLNKPSLIFKESKIIKN
ncbi:MAG: glucose-6-phosphate isomerase family protein [Candidatus Aenigmatarchaeota archaeon]